MKMPLKTILLSKIASGLRFLHLSKIVQAKDLWDCYKHMHILVSKILLNFMLSVSVVAIYI